MNTETWGNFLTLQGSFIEVLKYSISRAEPHVRGLKIQHNKDTILNLIHRLIAIPLKLPTWLFVEIDKFILNFMWEGTSPTIL